MTDILSTRLHDLQAAVENNSSALTDFWSEIEKHGAPIIESAGDGQCYVTFVWRDDGTTRGVDMIQDWGADGLREHHLTRLENTDVWYLTRQMKSDTRTTYQIAPDPQIGGFPFITDPLNPHRHIAFADESGGFTIWFSLLTLPDAPPQPWMNTTLPAQRITLHTPFDDARRLWVYQPENVTQPCSLLVVFDGREAKERTKLPEMLDWHLARGSIRPTIALLVDNPDRRELMCVPEFAEYIARQIVPWARQTFPVTTDAAQTVINGTSYGGLCAAYIGLNYADVFGAVLSQTGWYRWHPATDPEHEWLARQFIDHPVQNLRFYMDVGTLETARMQDNGPSQLVANRHMRDVLRAKGYPVTYREYSGGHDHSSTANALFDALPVLLK